MVERLVAAEFKMRSVRYLDAGLFHFQAESNPLPEQYNKEGRTNPMAWAFHSDAKYYNSFSKLIRYEGFLQREFSRVLRDLSMLQNERRARLAEAETAEAETQPQPPAPDPRPREQSSPQAAPKTEKTKRTQFPELRDTPDGGWERDAPQNPGPGPSPGGGGPDADR